jgi:antirestriction protein ArdC
LVERVESFDAMVRETGAQIEHGGDRACFVIEADKIKMPTLEQFQGRDGDNPTAAYYATLAHELTHWTGHKSRLDRTFGKRFGDQAYAVEELVAELGAAFALAEHGLGASALRHAGYLQSWLDVIKEHPKALFTASSKASQAVDYLHGRVGAQKAEAA